MIPLELRVSAGKRELEHNIVDYSTCIVVIIRSGYLPFIYFSKGKAHTLRFFISRLFIYLLSVSVYSVLIINMLMLIFF